MTPPDDIHTDKPATASDGPPRGAQAGRPPQPREIGPESEVRGGPEASGEDPAALEDGRTGAQKDDDSLPPPLDPAVKG